MVTPMGRLAWALAFVATTAWAGEVLLGTLRVADGGTTANRTTATPFVVPSNALLSIQCDQASYVMTDVATCDAGVCVYLGANMLLPTKVNGSKTYSYPATNPDGGAAITTSYSGGWVASSPGSGATSVCKVFSRTGQE